MAITYKQIASVTVGSGGAADIEFTSIPGTYTDLSLIVSAKTNGTADNNGLAALKMQFNGSSTSYTYRDIYGVGSGSGVSRTETNLLIHCAGSNNISSTDFGSGAVYIPNYAGSTNKSLSIDAVQERNNTTAFQFLSAGLWSNTAAITSIKLTPDGYGGGTLINQYSTATLYGILKA